MVKLERIDLVDLVDSQMEFRFSVAKTFSIGKCGLSRNVLAYPHPHTLWRAACGAGDEMSSK